MSLFSSIRSVFAAKRVESPLTQIIQPAARDRWLGNRTRSYTPTQIESILTGAFSGSLTQQWELFDLMEDTWPHLLKNLNELKNAVCGLDWTLHAWAEEGKDPTPESERRKQVVSAALWQMRPRAEWDENEIESTIRDLLDGWAKGLVVLEIDWTQGELPGGGSRILAPRCTRWIHPRYYGYSQSSAALMLNGAELAQVNSTARSVASDWIPFPPAKFLIGSNKSKSGHVIGGALLRPLAFWWAAANFTAEWFLNFAQIFGMPIRWATYDPARTDLLDQISDMLENLGSAGWGAFPAGTVLELKEASKTAGDNPQAWLLQFADKQADLLILGQTLTTDVGDSGSRALGDVHYSVRADIIEAAANWAAKILNGQLIGPICRLNFGDETECPWFSPEAEEVKDTKAMAERDEILLRSGVAMPRAWFYERHDIPMPAAGEEVIEPPTPQLALPGGPDPTMARGHQCAVHAGDATDRLIDHVLENLTGVQARWLGGVKPYFRGLILAAQNENLTDAQFIRVLEQSRNQLPELFAQLDHRALADALEASMGSACVNGIVQGAQRRRLPKKGGRA